MQSHVLSMAVVMLIVAAGFWLVGEPPVDAEKGVTARPAPATEKKTSKPLFEAGVCWVRSADRASLEYLKKSGVRCISVTPFAYGHARADRPPSGGYGFSRFRGESVEGVREVIQLAHECDMEVMIKPHIWFFQRNGKWRGDIAMTNDEDWAAWFRMYGDFLAPFVEMAREENVASFCIGTELAGTVTRSEEWRRLIAECRKDYAGKLTYSANWYKEYEDIQFWDALDQVGVQAYFPLSTDAGLNPEQIAKCWEPWLLRLGAFSKKVSRPIIFTEFGYRPVTETLAEPWKWSGGTRNPEAQATAFEGAFAAFQSRPWLQGVYVWKWFSPYTGLESGRRPRERAHDGFSPQGLPAEKTIMEWFRSK